MERSRRTFLRTTGAAGAALAADFTGVARVWAQGEPPNTRFVETPALRIGYEERGDRQGFPIVLLHGFPDDVRAWDDVAVALAKAGCRVLVPYLRGYGPTRFRDAAARGALANTGPLDWGADAA